MSCELWAAFTFKCKGEGGSLSREKTQVDQMNYLNELGIQGIQDPSGRVIFHKQMCFGNGLTDYEFLRSFPLSPRIAS